MKVSNIEYNWNPDEKTATCSCYYNGLKYVGIARCHPEDEDMMNEITGLNLAEARLEIQLIKARIRETKSELSALKQLYYSMNRSQYFNEKSYENKMLQRQIKFKQEYLDYLRDIAIPEYKNRIENWIEKKDKFYKHIRANRDKDKNK